MGSAKPQNPRPKPRRDKQGSGEKKEIGWGRWLNQEVNRLVRRGHNLEQIGKYTLRQFSMFVEAARETEAEERTAFVTDLGVVVGSLFSKESPIQEHMELLIETALGVKHGNSE